MAKIQKLQARYETARQTFKESGMLADWLSHNVEGYARGETALALFGPHANALDSLCIMQVCAQAVPLALSKQIHAAIDDAQSWNEIAVALGTSRQAARKRFGDWDSWFM